MKKIIFIVIIGVSFAYLSYGQWTESGNNVYLNTSTREVGIGTSSPLYPLHINRDFWINVYISNTYTGSSPKYGLYSKLNSGGTGIRYGLYSTVTANSADNSPSYGVYGVASGNTNAGSVYGVYGSASSSGTGNHYAVYGSNSSTASNNWAGYFTGRGYFGGNVGIGVSTPTAKLHIDGAIGDAYGIRMDNNYTGTARKYGIYNQTDAGGTGVRYGFYNVTDGNATDASTVYGNYNITTSNGSAANVYGVYSNILTSGTGDHYAIYGSASSASNYWAGYFSGRGYFSANVGLGTTAPVNKLDVEGAVAIGSTYSGTSTAPTNGLIVQGNVGIGTASPSKPLHVFAGTGSGGGAYNSFIDAIIEDDGKAYLEFNGSDYAGITFNDDATSIRAGIFFNYNDDAIMFRTGSVDSRMVISEAGNVGIGTNIPTQKLDVDGKVRIRDLALDNTKDSVLVACGDGTIAYREVSSITDTSLFAPNGSHIYNKNSGNIGIGTTTPTEKLTISNDVFGGIMSLNSAAPNTLIDLNNSGTNPANWTLGYLGNTGVNPGFMTFLNGSHRLSVTNNGDVGINEINPQARLEINSDGNSNLSYSLLINNDDDSIMLAVRDDGNVGIGINLPTQKLDVNGKVRIRDLVLDNTKDSILVACGDGTVSYRDASTIGENYWLFSGTDIYNANAGNVSIGISTPASGYMLSVDGRIICEELQILASGSWPDYVFHKKYDLWSLDDIEQYIENNNHLPGVPSAICVEKEGISLGEMSKIMMEKIEELTLHLIEQSNVIKELNSKVDVLENTNPNKDMAVLMQKLEDLENKLSERGNNRQ